MAQIIPISSAPNQSFSVQLQVDGNPLTLNLTIRYSAMAGYWVIDIADASGNPLLSSVPMLTGWYPAANMLAQYGYLKIGSAYLLNVGNTQNDYPGANDLGTNFVLVWGDTAA